MDKILISIEDVRVYRDFDPNYDLDRFNSFVRDVQRRNLRDFLGSALYYDLMENTTNYEDLINGEAYEYDGDDIMFYGLKPILVYWVLAKIIREGDQFIANYGTVEFTENPQQTFTKSRNRDQISAGHMETAQQYANDAIRYLDTKRSTYTLWESTSEVKASRFVSFKIT